MQRKIVFNGGSLSSIVGESSNRRAASADPHTFVSNMSHILGSVRKSSAAQSVSAKTARDSNIPPINVPKKVASSLTYRRSLIPSPQVPRLTDTETADVVNSSRISINKAATSAKLARPVHENIMSKPTPAADNPAAKHAKTMHASELCPSNFSTQVQKSHLSGTATGGITSDLSHSTVMPLSGDVSLRQDIEHLSRGQTQAKVSLPGQSEEFEARALAKRIISMTESAGAHKRGTHVRYNTTQISTHTGAGFTLPTELRNFMENRFGQDLGHVRIHTGERAAELSSQLNAHAFTVGSHIYFGKDHFQPNSRNGLELIAHELTHTFHQGSTLRRSEDESGTSSHTNEEQGWAVGEALDYAAEHANAINGFRLFTIVLGVNPINMSKVDDSPPNILRALVEVMPGGPLITDALNNHGIFDKVADWMKVQIKTLGMIGSSIKQALITFLKSLSWSDLADPSGAWERAKKIFIEPIDRIKAFAEGLVSDIIKFIKDAILIPLAELAAKTEGWDLLVAVLGYNPITEEEVAANPEAIIGGFMKLVGQQEVWENMKKANAVDRAWAWFQSVWGELGNFVNSIPGLFVTAFEALELTDIILVPRALAKVAGVFGTFLVEFTSWGLNAVWNLLEIIFDVVSPGALSYIKRTGAALKGILEDPMPFLGNLVKAAKLGFQNFADHFGTHLKAGLIDWLTGSLPGVYIPKEFTLGEIAKFAFSVLGISWQNVRQKLVKVVGEPAVKAMETGFKIVSTLVTQGPAAAWDQIKEQLTDLQAQVIGGITDFIIGIVVQKAIPKLLGMFVPGAGFIPAILSIYDTIMVFVNKLSQIGQVVKGFVDSIVAIAGGDISGAAGRVENILASIVSLAINFLAGFAGLGKVADKVMGVIKKVRGLVDKGLDALIAWIVKMAKKLFAKVFGKEDKKATDPVVQRQWDEGMKSVRTLAAGLQSKSIVKEEVERDLRGIKATYGFKELTLVKTGLKFRVHAVMNPVDDVDLGGSDFDPNEFTGESLWIEIARKINADELPVGEGAKISAKSLSWNSRVLLDLVDKSDKDDSLKAAARGAIASNLMKASLSTDEKEIYKLVNKAVRAVNNLYAETIATVPDKQLQAHHRPGVSESSPTFPKTRAGRKRASVAKRIADNVANLTAEENAISERPAGERPALIREYVLQLLEEEIEKKIESGAGPLEEFDLDVITREVHLGQIHGSR